MEREQVRSEIKALRSKAKKTSLNGFVENLDDVEYRKSEGISQSDIKTLVTEPFKYFNQIITEPTDSMIEGTLLHLLICEPHKLNEKFFITDAPRITKEIKDEACDRLIYKEKDLSILKECADSLKYWTNELFGIKLDDFDSEVSYFGEYQGRKAKGRADKISKDRKTIFDIKKCASAKHRDFTQQACKLMYGVQEVFYRELMGAETFGWIAVETKPLKDKNGKHHFMFGFFEASESMKEWSKRVIEEAFSILDNPKEWNKPIYPSETIKNDLDFGIQAVKEIVPPLWYLQ